jgi:hypothetical protein
MDQADQCFYLASPWFDDLVTWLILAIIAVTLIGVILVYYAGGQYSVWDFCFGGKKLPWRWLPNAIILWGWQFALLRLPTEYAARRWQWSRRLTITSRAVLLFIWFGLFCSISFINSISDGFFDYDYLLLGPPIAFCIFCISMSVF